MKTQTTLVALLLLLIIPVKADIIPNPVSAPNLCPTEPTSVRMVSEIISVDLYQDSATVEVFFEDFEPFIYYSHKDYQSLKNRIHSSPDTYFDNQIRDINTINTDDIAYASVVKDDTLNYPHAAVFIYSKVFYFALVKELTRLYSPGIFKKLAVLSTDAFFDEYEMQIETKEDNVFEFKDLLSPQTEIEEIVTLPGDNKKRLIIRCKHE